MKKCCLGLLLVVLAMSLVMVGCGNSTETTTDTASPTIFVPGISPTPTPADTTAAASSTPTTTTSAAASTTAPANVIKLTLSNWMQPPSIAKFSSMFDSWAAEFEQKTGGRYKVEVVHGGALSSVADSYDAVVDGVADIAQVIPQDTERPFPMAEMIALPWYQVRADTATKALNVLRSKGYFDKEFSDVKIIMMNIGASSDDLLTIKPITGLKDLEGMKIATGGGSRIDVVKALGAVPVFCPPPEVYSMLQKGVVEGIMMTGYSLYTDNTADFLTTLVNPVRLFRICHVTCMNKDVYNKMPDEVKAIIDDMDKDARMSLTGAKILADQYDEGIAKFLSTTGHQITLNAEDQAKLETICGKIFQDWIADKEAKGLPGKQIVNDYYNALVSLGVENPACGYKP